MGLKKGSRLVSFGGLRFNKEVGLWKNKAFSNAWDLP